MENIDQMDAGMEKLTDDSIRKLLRATEVLDDFTIRIADSFKNMEDLRKELKEEVTFLRGTHQNIKETLSSAVMDQLPELTETTNNAVKAYMEKESHKLSQPIKKLSQDLEGFAKAIRYEQQQHKRSLKKVGIAVSLAFCLGAIGSGFGLWWFFPQTQFLKVEFTPEQRKQMEYGALLQFALPKMSEKEQDRVWDSMGKSWKEYYEKLFDRNMK